jgi:OOP family OmpA-OmpF porin
MPIQRRLVLGLWSLLLVLTGAAASAQDVRGSKDHPLLTRYPGSVITEYTKNFNTVEFAVGQGADGQPTRQNVEGNATQLLYFYKDVNKQPSPLEVIRNYQNAIKGIGGEVVYERMPKDGDAGETTLKVETGGKLVWVRVEPGYGAPTNYYRLYVVETAAMQQVVSANKLLDELNKNGFIALYINFDTNKADLKADGQATVREIVAMLKSAPQMKVSIEGHTDNVGAAAANKTLSEARAKSVMNAVVAGGIAAGRLAAAGYGAEKPIADNRSEEGRAKNRRVELVKK